MKACWLLYILLVMPLPLLAESDADDDLEEQEELLEERLEEQLEEMLDAQEELEDRLEEELEERLEDELDDDLEDELEDELEDKLDDSLDDREEELEDKLQHILAARQLDELEEQLEDAFDETEPERFIALLSAEEWQALQAQGVKAVAAEPLPALGLHLITFDEMPELPEQQKALQDTVAPDHYYRLDGDAAPNAAQKPAPGSGLHAADALGWPQARTAQRIIGMMDSAIDTQHPCFAGVNIAQREFHAADALPDSRHGTAIAGLLAANSGCAVPGLLTSVQLVNAVVFARSADGPVQASAGQLIAGLDWLLQNDVELINMSLSGPPNPLLQRVLTQVQARGVQLLSSVGNDGAAAFPRYPAAYAEVIAITAVDEQQRIFNRAVQGEHVEFALPGVNLRVVTADGHGMMSGTSFATALATAVLASSPPEDCQTERERLSRQALDLGEAGRDPVFGFGLMQSLFNES
ncbi:S8 family serine peptidase [Thalassolituus hydrocarboniclasticus]|uniref:S8 family serine peptidase n=1 Tax=Thalassolituus hydrocarboniclasticus TaxID=2742796 RepID=A0ABY6AI53_9GAMM|nr:S8 family serine peptidase [Thalassolituus hydrocarboniclasticus]UXD89185.1 S8 family serine peptidase [Thalassolituus hydrocarboniclasticus]